jgi:hypothetical protein
MNEERRKSDRRVSPAIGEFAIQEREKLLARIAELEGRGMHSAGQSHAQGHAWLWSDLRSKYGDESEAEEGFYAGYIAAITAQQGAIIVPPGYKMVVAERKTADDFSGYIESFRSEAAALFNAGMDAVLSHAAPSPARLNAQPCAVVMPERANVLYGTGLDTQLAEAYNEALDEVARLNPPADGVVVPKALLANFIEYSSVHKDGVEELWLGDRQKLCALLAQPPAPSPVSGLVEAQYDPYPHGHPLHKEVFMALSVYGGGDTFEDGVRGLIAELKEIRAAYKAQGGDSDE